jgi:hypothetical protein
MRAGSILESDCRQQWLSAASGWRAPKQNEQSLEARTRVVAELTFPNAQHVYSISAQRSCHLRVSSLIAGQFLAPVRSIGLGYVAALGASVPEAAVSEYRDARFLEEKVWRTCDIVRADSPADKSISDKVSP